MPEHYSCRQQPIPQSNNTGSASQPTAAALDGGHSGITGSCTRCRTHLVLACLAQQVDILLQPLRGGGVLDAAARDVHAQLVGLVLHTSTCVQPSSVGWLMNHSVQPLNGTGHIHWTFQTCISGPRIHGQHAHCSSCHCSSCAGGGERWEGGARPDCLRVAEQGDVGEAAAGHLRRRPQHPRLTAFRQHEALPLLRAPARDTTGARTVIPDQ